MHSSAVLVAAALAASATTTALAISCYNATQCATCETTASLNSAAQAFCSAGGWEGTKFLPWGNAQIMLEGSLDSQQTCLQGIANIVNQCYGVRDGGIFTFTSPGHNARLDVDFCSCE